jgi:hypothetical protein
LTQKMWFYEKLFASFRTGGEVINVRVRPEYSPSLVSGRGVPSKKVSINDPWSSFHPALSYLVSRMQIGSCQLVRVVINSVSDPCFRSWNYPKHQICFFYDCSSHDSCHWLFHGLTTRRWNRSSESWQELGGNGGNLVLNFLFLNKTPFSVLKPIHDPKDQFEGTVRVLVTVSNPPTSTGPWNCSV